MMSDKKTKSRRDFIKTGALAAGSFFIVPCHVLGRGFLAPSDKLNIAAIGAGGKGYSDIINAWNNGANNVVALCDVDAVRAKAAIEKFPDARFYKDFRRMLEDLRDTIDAVTISTPDHTHAVAAMAAMQLGKHVYVQKPLTHNIREARQLTEAARQYRIVSQMGNQGASNPSQKVMMDWLDKGLVGKVNEVYVWTDRPVWPQGIPVPTEAMPLPDAMSAEDWNLWIGPAQWAAYHPLYHPFKWRGWWNFGTGALGDMGCHLIDPAFRVLGLGYPTEVECSVGQVFLQDWVPEHIPDGCPPSSSVRLKFPPSARNKSEVTLIWSDGGIRPFHPALIPNDAPLGEADSSNGVLMIGAKGVISCGIYGMNPVLYLKNGRKMEMQPAPESASRLPEFGHQVAWVEACKAGFGSAAHRSLTSSFDYAGPLTETVLMGNLAIRSYNLRRARANGRGYDYYGRRKLLWDGARMEITNFAEANQFVGRTYREGWQ